MAIELLPDLISGHLALLVLSPRSEVVLELLTYLALRGPVRVLDGGNSLNAFALARNLRHFTVDMEGVLGRIKMARAFTCYQMVTLLNETTTCTKPTIVLDLLTTFYDESVELEESQRLLQLCITQLEWLSRRTPVVVTARPPRIELPERDAMLEALRDAAGQVFIPQVEAGWSQTRLF
jgi:hypothetical protein